MAKASATKKKVAAKKAVTKKKATVKKVAVKKAVVKKKAIATKKATHVGESISAETRWNMVSEAAYYYAEKDGFSGDSTQHWLNAEADIDAMLATTKK
ncbi:MAG: DUF2934 domain-containing protein [Methylococcales bacterium]|jgi:hypothetical protein|nr:DUF2934 domain-containing protein [Methylococcales bacterium]MBT7409105.1 DUF2934 domain-containing protein [Methylococcales bacterium]